VHAGWWLAVAGVSVSAPHDGSSLVTAPQPSVYVLRGVVGNSVSISLPGRAGYTWNWQASGEEWLFDPPYRLRYCPLPRAQGVSPEVWIFPLVRPGEADLEFTLTPQASRSVAKPDGRRFVRLEVLTPYQAQQHAPQDLQDILMVR
jgi:hypothetical protein